MIDLAFGCTKAEVRAEAIPKVQPEGKTDRSKQPQLPHLASVAQHVRVEIRRFDSGFRDLRHFIHDLEQLALP